MEPLRPNGQRAKIAILFIWICTGLEVISLVSGYFQYQLLQGVNNGGELSPATASANDTREQIIAFALLAASIVSIVTFIQWFRRAYFNLHQRIDGLAYSEGWAAGSWFVPVISLFRPYQIMKELYFQTKHYLLNRGFDVYRFTFTALGWWWTLWIISTILGQFMFRYSLNAETLDQLITTTVAGMAGNLVAIPLGLITVKIIRDYAAMEPMLDELILEGETDLFPGGGIAAAE